MKLSDDLKPRWISVKGALFLVTGILAVVGILVENPNARTLFLLSVAIWSFCRFYYFLFYVIEKYVDGEFRFAGFFGFLRYLWKRRR